MNHEVRRISTLVELQVSLISTECEFVSIDEITLVSSGERLGISIRSTQNTGERFGWIVRCRLSIYRYSSPSRIIRTLYSALGPRVGAA